MSTLPRPCIHIGLPKAASKTFQGALFGRHPGVHYLGTYSGRFAAGRYGGEEPPLFVRDRETWDLLDEILWRGKFAPDFRAARRSYARSVVPALERGLVPVLSWESLVEDTHEVQRLRARNLLRVFGPCRILVVLRQPLELVESLYLQILERENLGVRAEPGRPIWYQDFEEWVEAGWTTPGHPPRAHLECSRAVETFADTFGADDVKIMLVERLREDPGGFWDEVCRFVGIDAAVGAALTRDVRLNRRLTDEQFERFQSIRACADRSEAFRLATPRERRGLLGRRREATREAEPYRVPISDELRARILDETRAGSRRLAERFAIPLERYGYPL